MEAPALFLQPSSSPACAADKLKPLLPAMASSEVRYLALQVCSVASGVVACHAYMFAALACDTRKGGRGSTDIVTGGLVVGSSLCSGRAHSVKQRTWEGGCIGRHIVGDQQWMRFICW
jgi:hypothetical protein